jgi:hypothetical protein
LFSIFVIVEDSLRVMATHPAFEGAGAKKGIEIWRIEVSLGNQY